MSLSTQVRRHIDDCWHNLSEGWHALSQRASHAITRFKPGKTTSLQLNDHMPVSYGAGWSLLPVEVTEQGNHLIVQLEIAGMDRGDVELELVNNQLCISGEKRAEREDHSGKVHVVERAYGYFQRVVPLPVDVDANQAQANYHNGVLKVTLPMKRGSKKRAIKVH